VANTSTGSPPTPTSYGIRGGAYDTPSIDVFGAGLSCTYPLPDPDPGDLLSLNFQEPTLGFRCCKK